MWTIFKNINTLHGWSFYEVAFIYGLLTITKSINHIFFDDLWVLGSVYIRQGTFDTILLRPISPLFHVIANKIQQDGFGNLLIGIIIISKSLYELNIKLGVSGLFCLILFIISGSAIFMGINIITSTSSFWIINSTSYMWAVFSLSDFALYPINIFSRLVGIVVTWIVPYGFASFYPANYFLNKSYANFAFLSPVIAVLIWLIAIFVWRFGLKHYASTGS